MRFINANLFIVLVMVTLSTISCSTTAPSTGSSELTIHLSTSNIADIIAGEVILQNNFDSLQFHSSTIPFKTNVVTFSGIEAGTYSLIMGSLKVAGSISVRRKKETLSLRLDETGIGEMIENAKQTYLATFLIGEHPEATIDDISFRPFMGVFSGNLVAVFFRGQYHGIHQDYVVETQIGHLAFEWGNGYPTLVWSDGIIYKLCEAFERDLLSIEDLEQIYNFYRDNPFWYLEIH